MMKRLAIFAGFLSVIVFGIWAVRLDELRGVRLEAVRVQIEQAEIKATRALHTDAAVRVDAQELARLRALQPELARLRGVVSALRQSTNEVAETLEERAAETRSKAQLLRARLQAQERSKVAATSMNTSLMLVQAAAQHTDGTVPHTWAEARARIEANVSSGKPAFKWLSESFARESGPQGVLNGFDIIPVSSDVRISARREPLERLVVRERNPRPQPDGGSARYYGWTSGRIEEVTATDGSFDAWEARQLGSVVSTEPTVP